MIIQRVNRTNPEKVFIVVRNDDSVAFVKGGAINFKFDGTRDGLDAELADTAADNNLVAGIADSAIPVGEYGLVQCYGVRTDAVCLGTNSDNGVGDVLVVTHGSVALMSVTGGAASAYLPAFALGATIDSTGSEATTTSTVFIRCM